MNNYEKILHQDYGELNMGMVPEPLKLNRRNPYKLKGCISRMMVGRNIYYKASVQYNGERKYRCCKTREDAEQWVEKKLKELREQFSLSL